MQEAFARGLNKLETLRDTEAVVPWFNRMLRNATADYFRRTKVRNRALVQFSSEVESSEEAPETVRAEACRCVLRLAETMKPDYVNVISALPRVHALHQIEL